MRFTIFYGIGAVLSKKLESLVIKEKIITRNQLNNAKRPQLRKILMKPHIFNTLPTITQADLKENPERKIPRLIMDLINNEFKKHIKKNKFIIVGSYIRGLPHSSDVDLILVKKNETAKSAFTTIKKELSKSTVLKMTNPVQSGDDKFVVFMYVKNTKYPSLKKNYTVKMDIFITNTKEYPFMLLYGTGSQRHNIIMRHAAKLRGYTLNQRGLYKDNKRIPGLTTEKKIFDKLGMTYKKPIDRK